MSENNHPLLQVRGLKTWFGQGEHPYRAVDGVDFDLQACETLALVGESGCGKSVTALSIMQLVPSPAGRIVEGSIKLRGKELLGLSEVEMRKVRGARIAMIFQEPMTSLNPVMTIGEQIGETLKLHQGLKKKVIRDRVIRLLDDVGLPEPQRRVGEYPHQLSGGMKQRVVIAIALAARPEILIADEPTTALDVTTQLQVLDLLKKLQKETGMAIMLITHDLGVVSQMADRVAVMYAGQLVEQGDARAFFRSPRHPYSAKLFQSLPSLEKRGQRLDTIKGSVPPLNTLFGGCRFAERCPAAWELCREKPPQMLVLNDAQSVRCHLYQFIRESAFADLRRQGMEVRAAREQSEPVRSEPLLEVTHLKVHFPIRKGLFRRIAGYVKAVDGVSLSIPRAATVALVGESGCGKTTVGKSILQLIRPSSGKVEYQGRDLTRLSAAQMRPLRTDLQFIFQDPFSSMNSRMMVGEIIMEGMLAQNIGRNRAERLQRVRALLRQVGLRGAHVNRYPHEFSGGQRQRIAIARALAVDPKLIVCDEPTSALDVSVQAQILNLLKDLQDHLNLSYLFITHNISAVAYLAHDIAVMYLGVIVEYGTAEQILRTPLHPYTRALLSAVPEIEQDSGREVIRLEGDMPSPANPPGGCYFHPRCPRAMDICSKKHPPTKRAPNGHAVSCFLY